MSESLVINFSTNFSLQGLGANDGLNRTKFTLLMGRILKLAEAVFMFCN